MTENQFQILIEMLHRQTIQLERIALAIEQPQGAPNYQITLDKFGSFKWDSIGTIVEQVDTDGVCAVTWKNNRYTRRSASNKFQPAIWFSRAIGKDDQGNNQYERLITFKAIAEPEPLPTKVKQLQHH